MRIALYSLICFIAVLGSASSVSAVAIDSDKDGLHDIEELKYFTDIHNPDSDGDGHYDGVEVEMGYSPHAGNGTRMHEHDYDKDGLNDWLEQWFQTDMGQADSDGDGVTDYDEVMAGFNPTEPIVTTTPAYTREIVVDRTGQRLHYYVDGVKLKNYPVSTGNPDTPTPNGEFVIQRMVDVKPYIGDDYYLPDVWWNMQFKPLYYIHGAYWHNDFGRRTHSHGCVNMRTEDAGELYKYVTDGTTVRIIGETPSRYFVGT